MLNLVVVPKSQNLARIFIKESNIDFLPKLISEKKFINVVKNLTIFVEEYEKSGDLKKIYINERIDTNKSKIIVGAHGAGFANLTFCNTNTKVIEIRPLNHPNAIYERVSKINKLDYKLYATKIESMSNPNGDIQINVDELKSLIK